MPVRKLISQIDKLQTLYHNYYLKIQEQTAIINEKDNAKLKEVNAEISGMMELIDAFQNETDIVGKTNSEIDRIRQKPADTIKPPEKKLISSYSQIVDLIKKIQQDLQHNIEMQKVNVQEFKEQKEKEIEDLKNTYKAEFQSEE